MSPSPRSRVNVTPSGRAGRFVSQPSGYQAFVPAALPPQPGLNLDSEMMELLSLATVALGRLDGVVRVIPDPDFFVAMYVRREAVLSSQIEGTQSSLQDLLEVELEPERTLNSDVGDIVNYVAAMRHGLTRLDELPLSLRLIREIHRELLRDGRGAQQTPGEFRVSQNWIGAPGTTITTASFVPPPPTEMKIALGELETFLHRDDGGSPLLDIGLAHAQFETIHPFLDGNGRVGRLLITLLLVRSGILSQPTLYLSYYMKRHRVEYYDRLMAVRLAGDWEGWLSFFLRGIAETADEAAAMAVRIFEMRERHRALVTERFSANGLKLLTAMFERPVINVNLIAAELEVTFATANRLVTGFADLGLLAEMTGRRRSRRFAYSPYLRLFDEPNSGELSPGDR